jgi:hypothetical protein
MAEDGLYARLVRSQALGVAAGGPSGLAVAATLPLNGLGSAPAKETPRPTADRVFGLLSDGDQVRMPVRKNFWSPRFGMRTDRIGVARMVSVLPGHSH